MTTARSARRFAPLPLALLAACGGSPPPAPEPAPAVAPQASAVPVVAEPASAAPTPTAAPQASATAAPSAAPAAPPSPCPAGMALIPGGEYSFGATKKDKVSVTVAPFCLDVNETTAAAYAACAKAGKCSTDKLTVCDPSTYGKDASETMPMVCIDFDQADQFCKATDKRLPSTEEWEWAARGASAAASRPWGDGDVAGKICWRRDKPCAIDSFSQGDSPQGVHDLLGGVFEWTTSKSDASTSNRIVRGGSWKDYAAELFDPARHGIFKATYRCGFGGVRCAAAPSAGAAPGKP
jgi:formylglycine-generating enzyme